MAPLRHRSIIVIDDEDAVAVDEDLIIHDHGPSYSSSSSQVAKPASTPGTISRQTTPSVQHISESLDNRCTSKSPKASVVSQFRSLDWSPKTPRSENMAPIQSIKPGHASRISSMSSVSKERERSCTLSLSPTEQSWINTSMAGTAGEPIELLADGSGGEAEGKTPERPNRKGRSRGNGSYSLVPKSGAGQLQQYILLDDDDKDGDEPPNALTRSLRRLPTADDELIDLEEIEDDLLQLDDQVLQIEEAYFGGARPQDGRRSSRAVKIDPRNAEIVFPFVREESLKHLGSTLLPNKTVELRDGSFLRIKDVVLNTQTKAVTLRGHRLQRTRDMNGMLEKKMNECLLFLEVDLDDHRDPLAQAIVETPLDEVVQLRNVRYTNEKFPINRNLDFNEFNTKDAALETGGLTARWKYTCRYASAINRYHNTFTERSLERLMPDECTNGYSTPDAARRFKWRGGTILGGAYQPTIDKGGAIFLAESRQGSIVSIRSSEEADEFALVHVHSIDDSSDEEDLRNFVRKSGSHSKVPKRKHGQLDVSSSRRVPSRGQGQKKMRRAEEESVREPSEEMSRMSLQPGQKLGSRTNSKVIDLSSRLSVPIDLTQSDLATPPRKGSIRTNSRTVRPRSMRTAGQRLTYGDSFCGAGGATRGAAMAGLRVIWGFDFWKRACETWEANFPYARCFCEPAHKFVEFAKRYPHLVKVDILHLSPPCQFFSPAHTINGVDDEMNTASLFAVQAVIEVTRPRIVTLEQTFGINHPRFRFYFNALIQMFTAHDFSIRWAIIPLAQWGLPQRRMRLIIIASCPGEILPRMPAATHSELGGGNPPLKPFTSVQSALSTIPFPNPFHPDPLHDHAAVTFAPNKTLIPWDASKILPRAMTTSGGGNYHPSGKRDFTLREYATLQGFPQCHIFKGSYVKKQIGNAVPPCVAKALFENVKKDLDATDGLEDDDAEWIE